MVFSLVNKSVCDKNSVKAEYRLQTYARYPTIYGMNYPEIYTSIWKKKKKKASVKISNTYDNY